MGFQSPTPGPEAAARLKGDILEAVVYMPEAETGKQDEAAVSGLQEAVLYLVEQALQSLAPKDGQYTDEEAREFAGRDRKNRTSFLVALLPSEHGNKVQALVEKDIHFSMESFRSTIIGICLNIMRSAVRNAGSSAA